MNKLQYTSFAALIAAFNAGVKFAVIDRGATYPVTLIEPNGHGGACVWANGPYHLFSPSGVNGVCAARLVHADVTPAPLLKRFLGGETFHVPKTGEVLHEVTFRKDELLVTLKDPKTGALRSTPRYNHEGKHKYVADRSLVAGVPPKPKKTVNIKVYKHAYNGSLFVIREGEVIPNIRGINNATLVGETTVQE